MKKKESFMDWFAGQLSANPSFHQRVEETLNAMRLEQDLIALREAQGVSQAQLAKALGVSQPAIAKLESGKAKNITNRLDMLDCKRLRSVISLALTVFTTAVGTLNDDSLRVNREVCSRHGLVAVECQSGPSAYQLIPDATEPTQSSAVVAQRPLVQSDRSTAVVLHVQPG
jgi:transcriptional regulator with XRE-family HTH domain